MRSAVALGRYRGTFKASGRSLNAQFAHVWTLDDGRVTSFQQHVDTFQAAQVTQAAAISA